MLWSDWLSMHVDMHTSVLVSNEKAKELVVSSNSRTYSFEAVNSEEIKWSEILFAHWQSGNHLWFDFCIVCHTASSVKVPVSCSHLLIKHKT